ncbi:MAG: U32 family peptidase [Clostridia bacterium]|nr:U32 family peptidase [Clostridia bacterium]
MSQESQATDMTQKPELLAPAGDAERLHMAVEYGADAVYLGGKVFSMRAGPENFTPPGLAEATAFAHARGVKVYLTCNTLPRNEEIELLPQFLTEAAQAKVDALIVTDLGVLAYAGRYAPGVELHVSTQAGIVNYDAANACFELGAKRVVLARELSLAEIAQIRRNTPVSLELEAFVHGSMCVSFSGRCLLSSYLTGRDANRGDCAQPCRWSYALMEEKRPGQYFPVVEDAAGTHILSSRDLCMIGHIPELVSAGVSSFKIEGRGKSAYYTAAVTNAYRIAIDDFFAHRGDYAFDTRLLEEVQKVSHREYCTGFYFGPIQNGQDYSEQSYLRSWDIAAIVERSEGGTAFCRQRNRFAQGDGAEVLEPGGLSRPVTIGELRDENGERVAEALHPDMKIAVGLPFDPKPFSIIRRKTEDNTKLC